MSAPEDSRYLLERFLEPHYENGLELWLDQGQLRFKGPKEILKKELITALKKHKLDIILMLQEAATESGTEIESAVAASIDVKTSVGERCNIVDAEYPLSMSQSAIWMLYQFVPNSPVYNTTFCARLHESVDISLLEKAYQNTVNRHDMLRSRFLDGDGGSVQQVMHSSQVSIDVVDGISWEQGAIDEWLKKEAVAPFDLSNSNALRIKCLKTNNGCLLIATIHHIAADLWSLLIIAEDLFSDYQHYLSNGYFNLVNAKHRYQEHVMQQKLYLQSDDIGEVREYWQEYLANATFQLEMPTDFVRPAIMMMSTARRSTMIDSQVTASVRKFCKKTAITPCVLFESAFQLLLFRYVQRSDFLIGTPTFGRSKQSLEKIVGDFANPVVLRANIVRSGGLADWLKGNQKDLFNVMALQDFPFPSLVELINPPRDASRTPLFQHMFVWHQGNKDTFFKQNLIEEILPISGPCGSPYDILLSVSDMGDSFECHWTYQTSLYEDVSINQFSQEYEQLIYSLLESSNDATIDTVLNEIAIPSLDICGELTSNVFFKGKSLENFIAGSEVEGLGYSLMSIDDDFQPVTCLHECGRLVRHCSDVSTILPLMGHYNAKGHIVATEISLDWGIVDKKLVNLREIVLEQYEDLTKHCMISRCCISDDGNVRNILYFESDGDEIVDAGISENLRKSFGFLQDIIFLSRFLRDEYGDVDRFWLLGIPVIDMPMSISRTQQPLISLQSYPIREGQNKEKTEVSKSMERVLVDAGEPALLVGDTLSLAIPSKDIVEALIKTAELEGDTGFVFVDEAGGISYLSYKELLYSSIVVANGLRKKGIREKQIVILQVSDRSQYFTLWWALLWLGAMPLTIAVPSEYSDEQPIARKLKNVVSSLADCVVVSDFSDGSSDAFLDKISSIESYVNCSVFHINDLANTFSSDVVEESIQERSYYKANDVAFLQLTSGSTGTPKVIQISHQGILHQVYAAAEYNQFEVGDKTLNWLPYDHVVPILTTHLRDVILGLSQYQVPTSFVLSEPLNWLQLMEKYDIQHSWSPNFGFKLVVDALNAIDTAGGEYKISSLQNIKTLMNAGEQVIPSVVSDFMRLLQPLHLRDGAIQSAFGMAESCTCITYDNEYGLTNENNGSFSSLGGVIPGVDIRIVDEDNVLSDVGKIGRMQIRGPVVTPGYLNNPSANEESFVGDGWFNSGDLGYISQGALVLTGREKEMIVIRGVNYYCYEIEESITRHPSVTPTFVAAFSVIGDSSKEELVVVYVESDNAESSHPERDINTIINREFGIEARYIVRVKHDQFHKTTSGKIQRAQFRKLFMAGEYKQQCLDFDRLMGSVIEDDLRIPYHIYESGLEKINISLDDGFVDSSYFTAFSFDRKLVDYTNGHCANRVVIEVNSVTDIALLSKSIPTNGSKRASSNILLLFPFPEITDVEAMQRLVISIADTVVQLDHLFDQAKRSRIDNDVVLHVVLMKPSQVSVSGIMSMKPLMDSLTQELANKAIEKKAIENVKGTISSLRLRIVNEPEVSDSLLEKIVRSHSVKSPLYFDADALFRPVLKPSSVSIRPPVNDGNSRSSIFCKVFVVTGGFGGLGVELVRYLLDNKCKIIVIGRRDIGQCRKTQTLAKNIHIDYGDRSLSYHSVESLDNTNIENSVCSGLQYLDEKSINGIFHLAGCYLQKSTSSMTDEDWSQCFDAKHEGSLVLGRYLQLAWPNAMLVNFSSINSYFGASDLSGYGTANALQNQWSDYFNNAENSSKNNGGVIRTFCLNWSVWPDIGMAQGFSSQDIALAKNKGFLPMSTKKDLLLLDSILDSKPGNYWLGLDHEKPAIAPEIDWKRVPRQWHISALNVEPRALQMHQYIDLPTIPQPHVDVLDTSLISKGQPPRNKTDEVLFDIWVSLLGSRVSHIDQTFFECGGNSVVVTQLMYKVTVNFNETLPLSSIFEYSTIRKFSDFLSRKNAPEEGMVEESAFSSAISSLNLVDQVRKLQIRKSGKDQVTLISGNIVRPKNTIIYVPALIGLPHSYQHLLHTFPECNQVLLSQDVLTQSEVSINQLASMYIELLRNTDVDLTRCTFVGWSFGGCVAFEMMRQLEASSGLLDQRKLIIIDSGIQDAIPLFLGDDTVAFPLFSKDLGQNLVAMEGHSNTASASSVASKIDVLQAFLLGKNADIGTDVLDVWFNTYKNNMRLLREYKPGLQRIDADVVYIKANGNALATSDMGWGEQFLNFNVIERESDHQQVVYDSVLVELIKASLQGGDYEF